MRLFKKHKSKDKLVLNVGIKECSTCDMNLRCEECVYQKENENIKSEIEMLEIENQSLQVVANSYKLHYNEARTEAFKELIERLTKEYAHYTLDFATTIDIFFCSVKRIAKEMVR